MNPPPASPKLARKRWFVVAAASGALILFGGGAYSYTVFFPAPERVIQEAFEAASLLSSASFSGRLRFEPSSSGLLPGAMGSNVSLMARGHFAKKDSGSVVQIALSLGEGEETPRAEMKFIERTLYAWIANSDRLGFAYGRKWLKVDWEEIAGATGGVELDKEAFRLRSALFRPDMWQVVDILPREEVGGKKALHYRLRIDQAALADHLQDSKFRDVYLGSLLEAEVWVGFWDRLPYRVKTFSEASVGGVRLGTYEIDFTFSGHGEPVAFSIPEETMTPSELMGILLGLGPELDTRAELLREARDAVRIKDLLALEGAISGYLAGGQAFDRCSAGTIYSSEAYAAGTTAVDGGGWVPIDFGRASGRASLAKLPLDPRNENQFIYLFACDPAARTFALSALMESAKFRAAGAGDVAAKDGGLDPHRYELGSGLSLIPRDAIGSPNLTPAPRLSVPRNFSLPVIQEDAGRIRDIRAVQSSLEIYYDRVGSYPKKISSWATLVEALRENDPAGALLENPAPSGRTYYYFSPDGASYVLVAMLAAPDLVESPFTGKISIWGKDLNCGTPGHYCVSF